MDYTTELADYNLGELRRELFQRIEEQKTMDQKKVKITGLLTNLLNQSSPYNKREKTSISADRKTSAYNTKRIILNSESRTTIYLPDLGKL